MQLILVLVKYHSQYFEMSAVKNADSWKEIAHWLSIEQLLALLLTGDSWMSSLLHIAPGLKVTGKYYPMAANLSGLTQRV